MAARVKGMPILKKSELLTSWPLRRRMPMPVMLAEAPMGVQLPPRVAPDSKPKYRAVGSMPISAEMPAMTGIMVAT